MKSVKPLPTPTNPLLANAQELGAHIRAARTQSGLTLEEAALSVGVAKQTMQNIETNPATVGLGTVMMVARALGVSLFAVQSEQQERARRLLSSEPVPAKEA
jgi:DNA-binding XRE family transcriptional regulator